jgi:hypothetical protein
MRLMDYSLLLGVASDAEGDTGRSTANADVDWKAFDHLPLESSCTGARVCVCVCV